QTQPQLRQSTLFPYTTLFRSGAQNHNPGDKVPLILPNFALPMKPGDKEPFVIKERKVFGITSQGMMCSPQELGLPDQVDGLLLQDRKSTRLNSSHSQSSYAAS